MRHPERLWTAAGALAALLAGLPQGAWAASRAAAESAITSWPAGSKTAAQAMIEQFGPPQKIADGQLVWFGPEPWKRTVVRQNAGPNGQGVLEQAVPFHAGPEAQARLAQFDARATADVKKAELTVRTDSPRENFLLANLANEVASGFRSPDDARAFYAKQIGLENAGKLTDYTTGLRFIRQPMPLPRELPNGKVGPATP